MDEKLLIIDDDAHLRDNLADSMELEGFKCYQAGNGKSGIESAKKRNPEVIILDIQLPDLTGFQICQELKKYSKEFIIVMMTGRFLSSEEKTQGFELGADEYITKPFDIRELSVRIRQLLSRKTK